MAIVLGFVAVDRFGQADAGFAAVFASVLAAVCAVLARGLFRGREWARRIGGACALLAALAGTSSLVVAAIDGVDVGVGRWLLYGVLCAAWWGVAFGLLGARPDAASDRGFADDAAAGDGVRS